MMVSQHPSSHDIYYLGIDGGGTKTALALADRDLHILRQSRMDCCNPVDIGAEPAKDRLREGIAQICAGIPYSQISLFAGIAGGTAGGNQAMLADFFASFGFAACGNDNDNPAILSAGLGDKNGITMILGTGICAFTQQNGVRTRTAGWGYLFDDGGSAYNIGRDGLTAYFQAYDGTGTPTAIADILLKTYPNPQVLLGELYMGGKKVIASYATLVYEAARGGDGVAMEIIRRNMAFAAKVVETAAVSLREDVIPVVLTGGLTKETLTIDFLRDSLTIPERFDVRVLDCEPVWGAVLLAKEIYEKTLL